MLAFVKGDRQRQLFEIKATPDELVQFAADMPNDHDNAVQITPALRRSNGEHADFRVITIPYDQSAKVIAIEEGQFSDVKSIEVAPAKLSRTASALANADGGDVFIGIAEVTRTKEREWNGFESPEAANGHIQMFEQLFPLGQDVDFEFLKCPSWNGLILHVQVNKTKGVINATNGTPYVRRGAQDLPCDTPEKLKQLEYGKGVSSFESETVAVTKDCVTGSDIVRWFVHQVVPSTQPEPWLRKQMLLREDRPTVAAVLLFADMPQAALPKHCGIKIYRYKTKEPQGFREALAFDPMTVEGSIYEQIRAAVRQTAEIVETIPKMGDESLVSISYPPEALHEIITNAVLHRDYSIGDDVHIRIFDNRIEVESPGKFPAHITEENILDERFARNGSIVRILNKFPDPPNKDVGEGLNTAFEAMHKLGLKEPVIQGKQNSVLVAIRHEPLASPEEAIMEYLETHDTINNSQARSVTHIRADYQVKIIFGRMVKAGLIEQVPGTRTASTKYRKPMPPSVLLR